MTPLTQDPKLVVLIDGLGRPQALATNVAPDLEVIPVYTEEDFKREAANKPFVTRLDT